MNPRVVNYYLLAFYLSVLIVTLMSHQGRGWVVFFAFLAGLRLGVTKGPWYQSDIVVNKTSKET